MPPGRTRSALCRKTSSAVSKKETTDVTFFGFFLKLLAPLRRPFMPEGGDRNLDRLQLPPALPCLRV